MVSDRDHCLHPPGRAGRGADSISVNDMSVDDEIAAKWFGLEIARIVVDACYRDLVITRYEAEKNLIQQQRRAHR